MRPRILAICLTSLFLVRSCGLGSQTAGTLSSVSVDGSIVLPLDYTVRHLFITLDDQRLGTLSMLVDTGTARTFVAKSIAKKEKLHKSFWRRTTSVRGYGTGPSKQEWSTVPVTLRAGQVSIFAGLAPVIDLAETSKTLRRRVDGVLGWDFFEKWCTTLDFGQKRLTLRPLSQCAPPRGTLRTLKGEWSDFGLVLHTQITFPSGRSVPASLLIDTGSDATLILNAQFRSAAGLPSEQPKVAQPDPDGRGTSAVATTAWGANGTYVGDIVPVKHIVIEDGQIQTDDADRNLILVVHQGAIPPWHWWQFADRDARILRDGTIGNAFLEQMLWTFNPAAKKIYIQAYGY